MNLSLISEEFQNFFRLLLKNKPLIEKPIIKNIMRIGIVTITILITTSVQLLFALPLKSQPIDKVEVSIGLNNETLVQAFQKIETQSPFRFMYRYEEVKNIRNLSLPVNKVSVEEFLKTILARTSLTYRQVNDQILIMPAKNLIQESNFVMKISGKVTDENGKPLEGVSVLIKGSSFGTNTDARGVYQIDVSDPSSGILVFSFVGAETQEVKINGRSVINISLHRIDQEQQEIVVVGYGTKRKGEITGAVSQVGSEVFRDKPITNIAQGLQGQIPNLNISFGDGQPNRGGTFNIRGMNSINGGSPLILIDGIEGDINLINPEDVESVSVLKDAASAAIYGARGSFGVILVTTKQGIKGKLNIRYSNDIGFNQPTFLPHVITDPIAAAELQNEAYKGYAGIDNSTMLPIIDYLKKRKADPSLPEVGINPSNHTWLFGANTDWYNDFFSNHQAYGKHFLSVSGGGDKVTYYLSGSLQNQDGVFKVATDKYKRYNFRSKLNLQATSWLQIYNNSEFDQDDYDSPNKYVNGDYNAYRYLSLFADPYYAAKTPDGNWTQAGMLTFGNLIDGGRVNEKNQIFKNTIGFQGKILKDIITVNGDFAAMWTQVRNDRKANTLSYESVPGQITNYSNPDFYQSSFDEDFYTVANLYGKYSNDFGKHHLDVLAGVDQEVNKDREFQSKISNNLSDSYSSLNLASGIAQVSDNNSDWALQGIFSRISYNYDKRYLVEFNGRYDGTSRFPANDRYGFFPSVSAGWMISREHFFKPLTHVINTFKLRSSYGSLGNQQVGTYAYIPIMNFGPITPILDGAHPIGTSAPGLVSKSLTWETARTFDIGADLSLLGSRLAIGLDWYKRNTINMLTKSKQLPAVLGTGEPQANAANLQTTGWETSFQWSDRITVANKPFSYNLQIVVSDNTSRITKYDNPNNYLGDYYVGQKIGEIWGYETDGFFKTDNEYANSADQSKVSATSYKVDGHPMAGDIKFKDLNADGIIFNGNNTLGDHGDMKIIGNSTPHYSYGFNLGASWNNFDFSVFFQGVGKRDFWPGIESGIFWGFYNRWNQPVYDQIYGNYWTPTNTNAYFPRPRAYIASHEGDALYYAQTRYLQNAAYLRMKNISIGYKIPAKLLSRVHIKSLRVFVSGQNLATWTKLSKAFDPETIVNDMDVATSNGNGFVYPIQKTFSAGVNLNF